MHRLDVSPHNLDAKGEWLTASGESAGFTPGDKLFRGHQIKWFGFT